MKKSVLDRLLEIQEKVLECEARGHPYPEISTGGYKPGRPVLVRCSNCNFPYQRPPTREEMKSYIDSQRFEVGLLEASATLEIE